MLMEANYSAIKLSKDDVKMGAISVLTVVGMFAKASGNQRFIQAVQFFTNIVMVPETFDQVWAIVNPPAPTATSPTV